MPRPRTPWYARYRQDRPRQTPGMAGLPIAGGEYAGQELMSTSQAYQFLLGSLRTNAPGQDTQNPIEQLRALSGIVYLAISSFATQAGQAEYKLYEHNPDDPEEREALSHWEDASQLLHHPNPDDTFGEILEQITIQQKCTGLAALWLPHDVNDPYDLPREMYVLSTASLLPQPLSPQYPNGAYMVQPWYPSGPYGIIPQQRGIGAVVPAEQIIRIKDPHPFFRWTGYATLTAISTQMDAARMIDITRMNHMSRGFDPAAILMADPSVKRFSGDDIKRLEAQLQAVWTGPQNIGRIAVAPFGITDLKTFGTNPKDMVYQEGWQQLMSFALACFKTSPAVAGLSENQTYATLYASLRWFYIHGLMPFLTKVAQKITRHVLQPFFDRSFLLEIHGKSITDEELVLKQASFAAQNKAMTVGEVRKLLSKIGFPISLDPTDWDDERVGEQQGAGGMPGAPGAEGGEGGAGGEENPLAALLGGQQPGSGPEEQQGPDQREMQKKRPQNEQGRGSLGPQPDTRKALSWNDRQDRLGAALDRAMTNGHARPIGKK